MSFSLVMAQKKFEVYANGLSSLDILIVLLIKKGQIDLRGQSIQNQKEFIDQVFELIA